MDFKRSCVCSVVLSAAALAISGTATAQSQRIVGGAPITIDEAPSIVALTSAATFAFTGSFATSQFCAGTLISPSWVVTAAHCVTFGDEVSDPSSILILANTFDLNNPEGEAVEVAEILVHEEYLSFLNSYDIALLRLETPVDAPTASIIDPDNVLDNGEEVSIAGWGTRQFTLAQGSFDPADLLEGAVVPAITPERCNALPAMAGGVDETMVCAGFIEGGIDACQGDSGGPLYRIGSGGDLVLSGITSWGIGCALPDRPGVYSNVAFFNDWILDRVVDAVVDGELVEPPVVAEEPVEEPEPPVVVEEPPVVVEEPPVVVEEPPVDQTPEEPEVVVDAPLPDDEIPVEISTVDEEIVIESGPESEPVDEEIIIVSGPISEPVEEVVEAPVDEAEEPVTIAIDEDTESTGIFDTVEVVAGSGGGGGSAGGLLLGAFAVIAALRRRSSNA